MAISGNTAIVGAQFEDSAATGVNGNQNDNSVSNSGAVYVYRRTGTTWSQESYLKASNPGVNDTFGYSVFISGERVIVGAQGEDSGSTEVNGDRSNDNVADAGAAYVFARNGTTWTEEAYLKASNSGASDLFGFTVSIDGDTAVVGAWGENSNSTTVNGDENNENASNSGAAYVFRLNAGLWSQEAYLKASNSGINDSFGSSVAISGNTIVIGANWEGSAATGVNGDQNNNSVLGSGAAYIFERTGSLWMQQAYLKASNTEENDNFGRAVAIFSDTVLIGARYEDSSSTIVNGDQTSNSAGDSGAAFVFQRTGSDWTQIAYHKAFNAEAFDSFSYTAVALSGDTAIVGAFGEDSYRSGVNASGDGNTASEAGAAYIFTTLANATPEIAISGGFLLDAYGGGIIPISDGDATPRQFDGTDFGLVNVDADTAVFRYSIRNHGTGFLNIAPPLITGPNAGDFNVTGNPVLNIPPGSGTSFAVSFDPSAVGIRRAVISVDNNDADENPYDFAIQGEGINVFRVLSLDDSGAGSLRQAILDANAAPGRNVVEFGVAGAIGVLTSLPALSGASGPITIDGTTAPGYAGDPVVTLQGPGGSSIGLNLGSPGNTIRGLEIRGFHTAILTGDAAAGGNTFALNRLAENVIGLNILSDNNMIGGFDPADGNAITANTGNAVQIAASGLGNTIVGNSIHGNGGLGIDLNGDGATPNDAGDQDAGANNLQNAPVLVSGSSSGGNTAIRGLLNSLPGAAYHIEFFSNDSTDPSGSGEGQMFLGTATVNTDGTGNAVIDVTLAVSVSEGQCLTATATDVAGNTSEFSNAVRSPNSLPGSNVTSQPVDETTGTTPVGITYSSVTSGGNASLTTSTTGRPPPNGFRVGRRGAYYDISTTATFDGNITICINYDETNFRRESQIRLYHFDNGWQDVTTSLDTDNNQVCGVVSHLSPFAIFEPVNTPPLAGNDTAGTESNQSVNLSIAKLLRNDSDADGDALTMTSFSSASAQGGTVALNGAVVTYTPAGDFIGFDTFTYTISDGDDGSAVATVTVAVGDSNTQGSNIVSISVQTNGNPLIVFVGIPGNTYRIQATTSLSSPNWQTIATKTAGGNGLFDFEDTSAGGATTRFYRLDKP